MLNLPAKSGKWGRKEETEVGSEGCVMLMWDEPMVRQINMQRAASFSQLVEFAKKSW